MTDFIGPQQPGEEKEPATARGRSPRFKIRYAPGHTDLFRTGAADDPRSEVFIPLEERSSIERARLFAKKKKEIPGVAEFY